MFRFVLICALVATALAGNAKVRPIVPQLDGRIVGGSSTTIQNHPHQVSLQGYGRHMCGGSVISRTAVLTAAHCTEGMSASALSVRVGSSYHASGGSVHYVKSICQHPSYNPSTTDSDVSVLILSTPITFSDSVQPINLRSTEVSVGTSAEVTGWGATSEGGGAPSQLQKVQIPRVSEATCKSAYGSTAITPRMSCYGYTEGGRDSCQGDSGGPLVANREQVGVVSWGYGCARPNYPGVYANLANLSLRNHIQQCQ